MKLLLVTLNNVLVKMCVYVHVFRCVCYFVHEYIFGFSYLSTCC